MNVAVGSTVGGYFEDVVGRACSAQLPVLRQEAGHNAAGAEARQYKDLVDPKPPFRVQAADRMTPLSYARTSRPCEHRQLTEWPRTGAVPPFGGA